MDALRWTVRGLLAIAAALVAAAMVIAAVADGFSPFLLLVGAALVVCFAAQVDRVRLDWFRRVWDAQFEFCLGCDASLRGHDPTGSCQRCGRAYDRDVTRRATERALRWGPGGPLLGWTHPGRLASELRRSRRMGRVLLVGVLVICGCLALVAAQNVEGLEPLFPGLIVGGVILVIGESRLRRAHERGLRRWRRRAKPMCDDCSHSLVGLGDQGVCPECGREFDLPRTRLRVEHEIDECMMI